MNASLVRFKTWKSACMQLPSQIPINRRRSWKHSRSTTQPRDSLKACTSAPAEACRRTKGDDSFFSKDIFCMNKQRGSTEYGKIQVHTFRAEADFASDHISSTLAVGKLCTRIDGLYILKYCPELILGNLSDILAKFQSFRHRRERVHIIGWPIMHLKCAPLSGSCSLSRPILSSRSSGFKHKQGRRNLLSEGLPAEWSHSLVVSLVS